MTLKITYNAPSLKGDKGGNFLNTIEVQAECNGATREREKEVDETSGETVIERVKNIYYLNYTTYPIDREICDHLRNVEHAESITIDTGSNVYEVEFNDYEIDFEQQGCCDEFARIRFREKTVYTSIADSEVDAFHLGYSYDCTLNANGDYQPDASTTKTARVGQVVKCATGKSIFNGTGWATVTHLVNNFCEDYWQIPKDAVNAESWLVVNLQQIWTWDETDWEKTDVANGETVACLDTYAVYLGGASSMTDFSALGLTEAEECYTSKYPQPKLDGLNTSDKLVEYVSDDSGGYYTWSGSAWTPSSPTSGQIFYCPNGKDGKPSQFFKWDGSDFILV